MTITSPTSPIRNPATCMAPSLINFSINIISAWPKGMAKSTSRKEATVRHT